MSPLLPFRKASPRSNADELHRLYDLLNSKEQEGDLAGMATCCLSIGDAYLQKGQSEEAEEVYRMALLISRLLSKWPRPAAAEPAPALPAPPDLDLL